VKRGWPSGAAERKQYPSPRLRACQRLRISHIVASPWATGTGSLAGLVAPGERQVSESSTARDRAADELEAALGEKRRAAAQESQRIWKQLQTPSTRQPDEQRARGRVHDRRERAASRAAQVVDVGETPGNDHQLGAAGSSGAACRPGRLAAEISRSVSACRARD